MDTESYQLKVRKSFTLSASPATVKELTGN